MKRPLIALLLFSACVCCTHGVAEDGGLAEPIKVDGVTAADGIDREEAKLLALRYFAEFHGDCGGVTRYEETPTAWRFRTVVGFDAVTGEDIVVLKDGSRILQKGGPDAVYRDGAWRYRGRNFLGEEGIG